MSHLVRDPIRERLMEPCPRGSTGEPSSLDGIQGWERAKDRV